MASTRIATAVRPRESPARRFAKRLVAGVLQILLRCSSRRAGVALLYHGIADRIQDPASDLLPPIAPSLFERQVRHLARVEQSWFRRVIAGRTDLPRLYSDDGDVPSADVIVDELSRFLSNGLRDG